MFYDFKLGKLFYKTEGVGTPLLIVHGFGVDHSMMEAVVEPVFADLDQSWCRVYVDLPGMGQSDPLLPGQYADDVCSLLSRLMKSLFPSREYGLVSHSYGSYLVRRLIYDHPQRILGAFFIAPVIHPLKDDRVVPEYEKRKTVSSLRDKYPELYDMYTHMAVVESEYAMEMFRQTIHPVLANVKRENLKFYQKSGYSCSVDINHLKSPFDKPSVFLLGKQDHVVGTHDSLTLQTSYPRADFIILDDAGHNLFFEQKEFFEYMLIRWMDRILYCLQ